MKIKCLRGFAEIMVILLVGGITITLIGLLFIGYDFFQFKKSEKITVPPTPLTKISLPIPQKRPHVPTSSTPSTKPQVSEVKTPAQTNSSPKPSGDNKKHPLPPTNTPISSPTPLPPIEGFTPPQAYQTYSSNSFNLFTNSPSEQAQDYLTFFEAFKKYFSIQYLTLSDRKIVVYIFDDPNEYLESESCDSIYGCYIYAERLFISHSQAGLGTYSHELAHGFVDETLPNTPEWFVEGLPTFFEKFMGYFHDQEGLRLILGLPNPWRVKEFVSLLDSQQITQPTLLQVAKHQSVKHAERLLTLYLYEHGWLKKYTLAVKNSSSVDNEAKLIQEVSGKSLTDLEADWESWLNEVIKDAKIPDSKLNYIPLSFVLANQAEWENWWAQNKREFTWITNPL